MIEGSGNLEKRNMTEAETLAFFERHGVPPFVLSEWKRGDPVLWVVEDDVRRSKAYASRPKDQVPSFARINGAFEITLNHKTCSIKTRQPVDYYAIDPVTQKIRFLSQGSNTVVVYAALERFLFKSAGNLDLPEK